MRVMRELLRGSGAPTLGARGFARRRSPYRRRQLVLTTSRPAQPHTGVGVIGRRTAANRSSYERDHSSFRHGHWSRILLAPLPDPRRDGQGDGDHISQQHPASGRHERVTDTDPQPHERAARHDPIYDTLHQEPDFVELRRAYRAFVFPATIAFLSWYLLYVVMSNWATGFMSKQVVGNINVALIFGVLQFVSTFVLAWLYARYMNRRVDPLARQLDEKYGKEALR